MGLLDPRFKYVPACATDLRKTFRRVRRALKAQQAGQKVVALRGRADGPR